MGYEEAVYVLIRNAIGDNEYQHEYNGLCPDGLEGFSTRDDTCVVCKAIEVLERS